MSIFTVSYEPEQMRKFRETLLGATVVAGLVLFIPAIVTSYLQSQITGLFYLPIFHSFNYALIVMSLLMARLWHQHIRAGIVVYVFASSGFLSVVSVGLLAPGLLVVVLAVIFAGLFFSVRTALIVNGLLTMAMAILCALVMADLLEFNVDAEVLHKSVITWLAVLAVFVAVAALVMFTVTSFRRSTLSVIGQLRQTSLELNKEKLLTDMFLDSLPGLFYVVDGNGKLVRWNSAHGRLLGYSEEEIASMSAFEYIDAEEQEKLAEGMSRVFEGEDASLEARIKTKDGQYIPFFLTGRLLELDGTPHTCGLGLDITELKYLERQLVQSQKLEAIGTLAGGIAHDFNNILTAILGNAELIRLQKGASDQGLKRIEEIVKSSLRARELVRQILNFSRRADTSLEPLELNAHIKEISKLIRASIPNSIEMEVSVPSEPIPVLGDATQIHQVLLNLCTNAYHSMQATNGRMEINLEAVEFSALDLERRKLEREPGPYAKVTVSDTGRGIPEEIQKRIFEPFFTTKTAGEGSGMGLSVVQGVTDRLGGWIDVQSELNAGSRFSVYWPLAKPAGTSRKPQAKAEKIPTGGGEHVLVVDDEIPILEIYQHALHSFGYKVTSFHESPKALDHFLSNPQAFDLVLTDQIMPKLNGTDMARQIIKERPDIPIVLISGFTAELSSEQAHEAGICMKLNKPVKVDALVRAVDGALAGTKKNN